MPLTLTYNGRTTIPVEIEGFTPDWARGKSLSEIARFEIYHGNQKLPLADFFTVTGNADDLKFRFQGDLSGVHWLGAAMTTGEIHVAGNVGRHLGSEMTGGSITVEGNASDWVGGEMHGGLIDVRGSAGHLVAAAYRGSRRGMTGGTILIGGNVGNEVGHTMRRGLLAVGGSCGDCAGFNMIAGSIYVFGIAGIRCGAGMRRGTIGLFGPQRPAILPTFRRACRYQPQFLRFTFVQLQRLGFPIAQDLLRGTFTHYSGDLLETGRGEILVRD